MFIVLIRHGESLSNADPSIGAWMDPGLTERGRKQVELLANRLDNELQGKKCKLFTSDRARAIETAELITKLLRLQPIIEPDLESYRPGLSPEVTVEESKDLLMDFSLPAKDWRPYRDGESMEEIFNRASRVLSMIYKATLEVSLVVSHKWTIDKMLQNWVGLDVNRISPITFDLDNASITILTVSQYGENWITSLNDTSHWSGSKVFGKSGE